MTPCRATGLTRKVGLWKKGARGLAGGEADPIWFGEGGGAREARGSVRQMWQREPDVAVEASGKEPTAGSGVSLTPY